MSLHSHRVLRKRNSDLSLSGSVIESDPTPTGSLLDQNPTAVPTTPPTGIPLVASSASTSTAQSSTPSASATSSSTSSSNQIPLGTVIGACIAALVALLLAVLLAVYCSRRQKQHVARSKSRNAANNVSRRRSHLEPWKRMDDGADRLEGQERPMRQRPPSGPLGAMFQRTTSNTSGDKSLDGHNRESVGTMQHFAKYHPGLAAEMASQGTITGMDGKIAKPPPVLHLINRGADVSDPVSWDGETMGGESFISLHSSLSNSVSPLAKATPPATSSSQHRWESAEVLHADFDNHQNPFSDNASSVRSTIRSSTKGRNPFFSAQDHPMKRKSLANSHRNPFADDNTPRDSAAAIQSLIAALEDPKDRIVSVQSSVYSRMTGDDAESAVSVTAFPYPPSQVSLR